MPHWVALVVAALTSAVAAVVLRERLARFDYRIDDEVALPRRRTWWVVPATVAVGTALAASVVRFDSWAVVATYTINGWVMVALAFIDLDVHRLLDRIQLPAYPVLVVLLAVCSATTSDWHAFVRALICGVALWVFYFILALLPSGFGFGDVKLAGLIGLLLGWLSTSAVVNGTLATFIVGGLVALTVVIARHGDRKSEFAYGPSMLVGAVLAALLA